MSKEKKKVDDKDLEQVCGGKLDSQAKKWLRDFRKDIEARAKEKRNWDKVRKILVLCVGLNNKYSLEEFKARLRRFIEVDDLILK